MILGTVELGLAYGINNVTGKPNQQQAFNVLGTAWDCGVRELDTAAGYGESETLIGLYQEKSGHSFLIDTKLPVRIEKESIPPSFYETCKRLKTDKIHLLYLHSFAQCKEQDTISFLHELKSSGKINHIGVSIYDPEEMSYIIDNLPDVDTIQFPFNVFDSHRWKENNLLSNALAAGKHLYIRSVYLQGLIFRQKNDPLVVKMGASDYIAKFNDVCNSLNLSVQEFAYQYVRANNIENIIIGCQTPEEVKDNAQFDRSSVKISASMIEEIEHYMVSIPTIAIDPRRWKNL
ncbi:MAG: aldo/keto reductase [Lachnospiraceae bacterium]|nr:aldo/keto reductase [Lachnospiraceae bacterium]